MHPQPTAIELLARAHRADRLAAAAQPRPARRPARRSAPRSASWAPSAWLPRALRPTVPAPAPCCA